jgi:cytochrome c
MRNSCWQPQDGRRDRGSTSEASLTANGQTRKFWERNLRLKTDASGDGPERNAPRALVGAGMMGDRADVIFADPNEISSFITGKCE